MRRIFVALTLLILTAFAASCANPTFAAKNRSPGTVKISFKTGSTASTSGKAGVRTANMKSAGKSRSVTKSSRTIVANWDNAIASYAITLHCTSVSTPDLTGTATNPVADSDGFAFSSVAAGTWNVSVTALNSDGAVVGAGSDEGLKLESGSGTEVGITISETQTGTGSFSFTFQFPQSSADYVSVQRYDMSNAAVGAAVVPTIENIGDGIDRATVAETGVASGTYRLALTFRKGGEGGPVVGTYSEALNVWDNVTSDQWLGSYGIFLSTRNFSESEFASTNASLGDLAAIVNESSASLTPGFSSDVTSYTLNTEGTSIWFIPARSSGSSQRVQYQVNGTTGTWTDLAVGASTEILSIGSTVYFLVTAPDQATTRTYSVSIISEGSSQITVSYGSYQSLSFSPGSLTMPLGEGLAIGPNFSNGTNWKWYVNGSLSGDASSYTFTPSSTGTYVIYATVTDSTTGTSYSGSMTVTVTNVNNLLTNPGWTNGEGTSTTGWAFTNGGDGWCGGTGLFTNDYSYVSSYDWCTFTQTVDLTAAGYTAVQLANAGTVITFSVYVRDGSPYNNGSHFYLELALRDSSDTSLDTVSLGAIVSWSDEPNIYSSNGWTKETVTYTNTQGFAIAHVQVKGMGCDHIYWGGCYGAWFSHPELTVTLP
jgi:hypothetical protein